MNMYCAVHTAYGTCEIYSRDYDRGSEDGEMMGESYRYSTVSSLKSTPVHTKSHASKLLGFKWVEGYFICNRETAACGLKYAVTCS